VASLFACVPVCTFFTALGLLGFLIVLIGAYNRTDEEAKSAAASSAEPWQLTGPWVIAIAITIVVPTLMLLGMWLLPEW
jgi:mannose/fructose/N-acetylgalactosamine-specific phosphotransferase system component IIC